MKHKHSHEIQRISAVTLAVFWLFNTVWLLLRWLVMSLELHTGGRLSTSPLFSDSKSHGFSAYGVRLTKSFGVDGSALCLCVCVQHFYCAPQRSKQGRFCQKLITRKHHYVTSCSEKPEQTMDGDKHKPRKYKIDCLWGQRWAVNHVCFADSVVKLN